MGIDPQPAKHSVSYNMLPMTGSMLIAFDLLLILLAAAISAYLYNYWLSSSNLASITPFGNVFVQATLIAAILAPFILYDRRFGAVASRGQIPLQVLRAHFLRFILFASVILALGAICRVLDKFPASWLLLWFFSSLLLTSFSRVVATWYVRRLQQQGALTEVIAIVGAGPVADRLVQVLCQTRPETVKLLGIFDDKSSAEKNGKIKTTGNLAQLLEIGKTHKIDWIILTLPPTAEQRVLSLVQRLKALSVSIGLCPQHVGLAVPCRTIDYIGNNLPVGILADRPAKRWDVIGKWGEELLPRWIVTLTLLPLEALDKLFDRFSKFTNEEKPTQNEKLIVQLDNYDTAEFTNVAANFGRNHYGYVVTPNADHLIRLYEDMAFVDLYATASYILLDSRFLARIMRVTKKIQLPVCTGSDLTEKLFSNIIQPDDPLVLIGSSQEQAQKLCTQYGLNNLAHFNPPMGFIHDPELVESCLHFIESHSPFRFCLLAVGSPQQEIIAQQLKLRGIARGLSLCIGASINFITGDERRAPLWMQHYGIEWSFRLMQSPGRMARRYLIRGPRVFRLLHNSEIILRKKPAPIQLVTSSQQQPVVPLTTTQIPVHHSQPERVNRSHLSASS